MPEDKRQKTEAALKRVKPHSDEAEQALLACMLNSPTCASDVVSVLKTSAAFYNRVNATIFSAIQDIIQSNGTPDIITVNDRMEKDGTADTGTLPYLADIVGGLFAVDNYHNYLDIVKRDYFSRLLIDKCSAIVDDIYSGTEFKTVLSKAEKSIFEISEEERKGDLRRVSVASEIVMSRLDEMIKVGTDSFVTKTGYKLFDQKVGGLANSDLIILAARPAVGKTSFALNLLLNIATRDEDKRIAFFSLEMSDVQLAQRLLANISQIELKDLQRGTITDDGFSRAWQAHLTLSRTEIFIDDTSALTPQNMISKCRKLVVGDGREIKPKKLDLIVIDYLQLMEAGGRAASGEGRTQEVSKISRMLKVLAKEMDCPVIALSQMNRSVEMRDNKRPQLSDLRESGSIEQDADIVMFLYKDEQNDNCIIVDVAKHRHGELSQIRYDFIKDINRFQEAEDQTIIELPPSAAPRRKRSQEEE